MKDLSMHITDIVQNSVRAEASLVELRMEETNGFLHLQFNDDGCGMDAEMLARVTDPFFTTRTTRKVGLGLPLIMQNAEQTGGRLTIDSQPGVGTTVKVSFGIDHLDRPPMGDLASTMAMLITGNPQTELIFSYTNPNGTFELDSREVKEILGDVDIRLPKVTSFLKEMINENLKELRSVQ